MKQIITMHGWCSNSDFWGNWYSHFPKDNWLWGNNERGYSYHQSTIPNWYEIDKGNADNKKVVICHSLGLQLIDDEILHNATHVILLNCFSSFVPKSKVSRSLKVGLNGMLNQFGTKNEKSMLKSFKQKAGIPKNLDTVFTTYGHKEISQSSRQKLREDLNILMNSKKLPVGINPKHKVLNIYGLKDKVVCLDASQKLSEDLKERLNVAPVRWEIEDLGHSNFSPTLINKIKIWLD